MLADGTVLDVANVIWATGFRPDYRSSRRRSSATTAGRSEARGVSPTVPGLYFLGVPFQYAFTSMLVAGAGRDAGYVVEQHREARARHRRRRGGGARASRLAEPTNLRRGLLR